MTPSTIPTDSVLLPMASLSLLAAGAEGAVLLNELGFSADGFEDALEVMLDRLGASTEPESRVQAEISQRIVEATRAATGLLTVSSLTTDMVPSFVFRCGPQALVVRPHGGVAEWLLMDLDGVVGVVAAAIESHVDVLVNSSRRGRVCAALYVRDGELRVAAKDAALLARLAGDSLADYVDRLLDEMGGPEEGVRR